MQVLKWLGLALLTLVALGIAGGVYLLGSESVPETSTYSLDLEELRRLARSLEGELPSEIRSELVGETALPRGLIMAGESFDAQPMVHPVFQVLYPDERFILIDTAFNEEMHAQMAEGMAYDVSAFDRVLDAMTHAWQIVVTHEHGDHVGGIAAHPDPDAIVDRVRMTPEQLDNRRWLDQVGFSVELAERMTPLEYDDALAIAPGVVLKRAPGHTPGSQLVFVTLADGRELLFVGDVAWNMDALVNLRYRPRLVTDLVLDEDRDQVLAQFRALYDLIREGGVTVVVSHDPRARADYDLDRGF